MDLRAIRVSIRTRPREQTEWVRTLLRTHWLHYFLDKYASRPLPGNVPMPIAPFRASSLNRGVPSTGFTDWEKGQIVGTADIVEETKNAFQRNEWFGAFARLHCMIEFWMQEIYEFDSKKDRTVDQVDYL